MPRGGETVTALVGIYDADGGLRGELAYVIGHLLGRRHCSLCDITHSPVRRKPQWDRMVASLPVPMTVVHRNEARADELRAAGALPAIVARTSGDDVLPLLGPDDLDRCAGDVDRARALIVQALAAVSNGRARAHD